MIARIATATLLSTLCIAYARPVAAQHIQSIHASACKYDLQKTFNYDGGQNPISVKDVWLSFSSIECPFIETDDFPKTLVNDISLFGKDVHTAYSAIAKACVTIASNGGGSCGPAASSGNSFTGSYWLPINPSAFHNYPNEYAYLQVSAPNSGFTLYGYDFVE